MLNKEISLKKFLIVLGVLAFILCFIYLFLIPSTRHRLQKEGQEKYEQKNNYSDKIAISSFHNSSQSFKITLHNFK